MNFKVFTPNTERRVELSFNGMEGGENECPAVSLPQISSFECLQDKLEEQFSVEADWECRKSALTQILKSVKLPSKEISKYVHWNRDLPYSRNLVATDEKNYTLLVLCWNAGRESRIHNHPCQGCFVLPLSGSIVETIYSVDLEKDEIREECIVTHGPGQVSFMNDEVGLHKIGTAHESGAVSLHLYTPPFFNCKVHFVILLRSEFSSNSCGVRCD